MGINMRNLRLSEICNRITDGSHNPPKGVNNSDFLMISSKNIFDDKITLDEPRYLTEQDFIIEHNRTQIKSGDILLTIVGTVGRVAVFDDKIGKITLQRSVAVLHPNTEICNSRYLMYLLRAKRYKFEQGAKGVAQKGIYLKELANTELSIVDRSEQDKIVTILDNLTELITSSENQIKAYDTLIKSRFVEMFGDPISNPFSWSKMPLDECLESIENGKSFVCNSLPRAERNPAILKLSAVTYGIYKPEENKEIIDENDFVESAEVHEGDLLFTRKNTPELVGMAAYVASTSPKLMMPDLIFRLNTKNNCNKIFLWKLINLDLFRKEIQNIASGSAKSMSNMSKERLGKLSIYLPPIELQNQFAAFVHQIDKLKFTKQKP